MRPHSRLAVLVTIAAARGRLRLVVVGGPVSIGAGLAGRGPARHGVRDGPGQKVAAFAFDAEGRLWVATADYTDSRPRRRCTSSTKPRRAAGRRSCARLHTPLGLLWYHDALVRHLDRPGRRVQRPARQPRSRPARRILHAARARRREQRHRARARRADDHGHLRAVRPLHARSRSSRARSSRSDPTAATSACSRAASAAPVGLAFYPGTEQPPRHDEPTRRPRRRARRRLVGAWCATGRTGNSPRCYGQGGTGVRRRAAAASRCSTSTRPRRDVAIVTGQLGTSVGTAALVAEWAKGDGAARAARERGPTATSQCVARSSPASQNPVALRSDEPRPARRRLGDRHDLRDRAALDVRPLRARPAAHDRDARC